MNAQIRELLEQAIQDVNKVTGDEFIDDELSKMYIPDCFAEKFADIIIKECRDICVNQSIKYAANNKMGESGSAGVCSRLISMKFL